MGLSVYIHIPFCSRRCDYCDFATWTDKENLIEEYVGTLKKQWKLHVDAQEIDPGCELTSIFFGGGTPNYIDANYVSEIIELIFGSLSPSKNTEITVESNPDYVTLEKMKIYKRAGVNRISLGIQSTNLKVLNYLGREHNPEHVSRARSIISQVGITNVSGDLIYGAANETLQDWEKTLKETIALDLTHISAYALGVETGTALAQSIALGEKQNVKEEDLADKYEIADEVLNSNGFSWYEISNWSKENLESRHNLAYWRGGEVVALGCAAHSFINGKRFSTPRHINTYLEKFNSLDGNFISQDRTSIGAAEENFALKLRTRMGVEFARDFKSSLIDDYVRSGLIHRGRSSNSISLTVKGRLVAHSVTVDLFPEYEQMLKSCTMETL